MIDRLANRTDKLTTTMAIFRPLLRKVGQKNTCNKCVFIMPHRSGCCILCTV